MGREKLVVIYEKLSIADGHVKVDDIVSVLKRLQSRDVVKYSFAEVKNVGHVKFWKAVIICNNADNFNNKLDRVMDKFAGKRKGKIRIVVSSEASLYEELPGREDKCIFSEKMADIATWWPKVLHFLLLRKRTYGKQYSCLLLFDGNTFFQNQEEHRWYKRMSSILQSLGRRCYWINDVENGIINLDGNENNKLRPDFMLVLSQKSGIHMFKKSFHLFRHGIKTIVITDDKKSKVCDTIDRTLKDVYFHQTENPMDLTYAGWSGVLRELNIVKCRDIVKDPLSKMEVSLTVLMVSLIIIFFPIVLLVVGCSALATRIQRLCGFVCADCGCHCCCDCYACLRRIPCCIPMRNLVRVTPEHQPVFGVREDNAEAVERVQRRESSLHLSSMDEQNVVSTA